VPLDEQGQSLPPKATPQQRAARGETFTMAFHLATSAGSGVTRPLRSAWAADPRGQCCPWRTRQERTPGNGEGHKEAGAHRSPRPFPGHPPADGQARLERSPPLQTLHPNAPEVMTVRPQACYNFVTLGQDYDKLHGPWTSALVGRGGRDVALWRGNPGTGAGCGNSGMYPGEHVMARPAAGFIPLRAAHRFSTCADGAC
jgi:hypothetical protein